MSELVYTCPEHEGYKLSNKMTDEGRWCKKCRKYRLDAVERPPQPPVVKIDLDKLMEDATPEPTVKLTKTPTISETLAQLPMNYRNEDLCPTCNPVEELAVSTNRYPVATDKTLDGWTVEEMVTYLQGQYNTAPETNSLGKVPRMLVKAQIITLQTRLGIHKPN